MRKIIYSFLLCLCTQLSFSQDQIIPTEEQKIEIQKALNKAQKENYKWEWYDGLLSISINEKIGLIDSKGKAVTPFIYDKIDLSYNNNGLLPVSFKGKMGLIDTEGKVVIPFIYDNVDHSSNNPSLIFLERNDKIGLYNVEEKTIIANGYDAIDPTSYLKDFYKDFNLIAVRLNNKYGFIDLRGNIVIPIKYDAIKHFKPATIEKEEIEDVPFARFTYSCPLETEKQELINNKEQQFIDIKLNNKWGTIDATDNIITPPKYDDINFYSYGGKIKLGNKWGTINLEGKIIIPPKYDDIDFYTYGSNVKLANKWGHIDNIGNIILSIKYDNIDLYKFCYPNNIKVELFFLRLDNKNGLADRFGTEILPPIYDKIGDRIFLSHRLNTIELNKKIGLVNNYGQLTLPVKYDKIKYQHKGLSNVIQATVNNTTKYGVISDMGDVLLPPIYDKISSFSTDCNYTTIKINNKYGLINRRGEIVIPIIYDSIFYRYGADDIPMEVGLNGKYGLINTKGEIIVPIKYDEVTSKFEAKLNDKWGILNKEGEIIIPLKYENIRKFSEDLIFAKRNGKWSIFNSKQNIDSPKYDEIAEYARLGSLIKVKLNDKYGYINSDGLEIIPTKYDDIESFYFSIPANIKLNGYGLTDSSENITALIKRYRPAIVKLNNKYGLFDYSGNIIVPIRYDEIIAKEDYFKLKVNNKYKLANYEGNLVTSVDYDDIILIKGNLLTHRGFRSILTILVKLKGKWGSINLKGENVISTVYDKIEKLLNEDSFQVWRNNENGILDFNGKIIEPLQEVNK